MPIRAVVFDLGNVLIRFDPRIALKKLVAYTDLSVEDLWHTVRDTELEHAYERGEISTSAFIQRAIFAGKLTCSEDQFLKAFQEIFWENDSVVATVRNLQGKTRLLLASNTNDGHFDYLTRTFDVLNCFDHIGVSHLAKARKPERAFYQSIQNHAHCLPEECLFFDDLPANVEAAKAFGWNSMLYHEGFDLLGALREYGVR
jgi:glucose-1-phosphatase